MSKPTPCSSLVCYIEGQGINWEGLCVDLDIAVQGVSFDEVRASLLTAVELYLKRVRELPAPEQQRFLNRRAPWHVEWSLKARMLWGVMRPRAAGPDFGFAEFTMPRLA